jgi:hypothetical protein
MDPSTSVRIELNYTAAKNDACRHSDPVLDVDRIKQAAFQWFPSLHGDVLEQFNRQRSRRRDLNRCRLTAQQTWKECYKRHEREEIEC